MPTTSEALVLALTKHVRTPEGAAYFNLPIGAPITAADEIKARFGNRGRSFRSATARRPKTMTVEQSAHPFRKATVASEGVAETRAQGTVAGDFLSIDGKEFPLKPGSHVYADRPDSPWRLIVGPDGHYSTFNGSDSLPQPLEGDRLKLAQFYIKRGDWADQPLSDRSAARRDFPHPNPVPIPNPAPNGSKANPAPNVPEAQNPEAPSAPSKPKAATADQFGKLSSALNKAVDEHVSAYRSLVHKLMAPSAQKKEFEREHPPGIPGDNVADSNQTVRIGERTVDLKRGDAVFSGGAHSVSPGGVFVEDHRGMTVYGRIKGHLRLHRSDKNYPAVKRDIKPVTDKEWKPSEVREHHESISRDEAIKAVFPTGSEIGLPFLDQVFIPEGHGGEHGGGEHGGGEKGGEHKAAPGPKSAERAVRAPSVRKPKPPSPPRPDAGLAAGRDERSQLARQQLEATLRAKGLNPSGYLRQLSQMAANTSGSSIVLHTDQGDVQFPKALVLRALGKGVS